MTGRRQPRVESTGRAVVYTGPTRSDEFAIRDLSTTGARLIGTARMHDGEPVRVVLHVRGEAIDVMAEVVRADPQRSEAAVAFRNVAPAAREALERAVLAAIEEVRTAQAPSVIVLHPDAETREGLERDLARLQRRATLCATSLQALWAFDDKATPHVAVIVCGTLGEIGNALIEHFAEVRPATRRILLFGEQLQSVDRAIAHHVDAVLRMPWRIRALSRALGIEPGDSSIALLPATAED